MATREEIEHVFSGIVEAQPVELLHILQGAREGIGCVLKLLCDENKPLTSGEISQRMGVSTARVAVLLRKMSNRGYIVKQNPADDARVVLVSLTEEGRKMANAMQDEMCEHVAYIIDKMGMEKIDEFIKLSEELKSLADEKLGGSIAKNCQ